MLNHIMLNSRVLAQTLREASSHPDADVLVPEFFSYLEEKNLLGLLKPIGKHLVLLEEEEQEFNTILIKSKNPLPEEEIVRIKSMVGASTNVPYRYEQSPELIGSIRVFYQGKRYDASLQTAINQLEEQLTS
jgi:F0F1-type ATP synthase delta subunit